MKHQEFDKRSFIKIILILFTIIHLAVIFMMSAAPADISADMSGSITYRIAGVIVKNFSQLSDTKRLYWIDTIDHIIRKCAHFAEYTLLGFLLSCDVRFVFEKGKKSALPAAWLFGICYAASDEWHQTFVEGRSGQISDVCLDSAGVLFGVMVFIIVFDWLWRMLQTRRQA